MKLPAKTIHLSLLLSVLISTASAQIPRSISYQGVLTEANGNPKPDGDYAFTFRLYETNIGGAAIWSETKTLAVERGLFSTALGDQTAFGPEVKFDKPYWLGIQVGNEAELPQRIALSASAYSLNSIKADVAADVAEGQVVKSINALKDDVILEGAGGATVTAAAGKITISAAGGGGTGIQGVQNTDNTLDITNPNGPTATVNLKYPLILQGNVGIGTTPTLLTGGTGRLLSISDPLNPGLALTNTGNGGNQFFLYSFTGGLPGSGSFRIYDATNSVDRFVLTNAGHVGIGTATPAARLDVASGSGDMFHLTGYEPFMTLYDTNHGYARGAIQQNGGGLNMFTDSYLTGANPIAFTRLDNNGNFGIGAAAPTAKLEVASYSGDIFHLVGYEPFMTFYDSNHGYARGAIQQVNGGLNLFTDSYLVGANPLAYIRLDNSGNVGIGTATPQTKLDVVGTTRTGVLQITGGSDMAEPFETENEQALEPGTVVIIDSDHPGKLIMSEEAYDSKVAGIVSGAGGVKAGLTLHQEGVLEGSALVAIAGRVYCKAEAIAAPIQPGDLLTTSGIAGHAMKAVDKERSHGAIIGKAMSSLKAGRGLVLVLVNLQ
jgi:hypothetical protein